MARKTATYVRCDNPNCKELAEVQSTVDAPDGWYKITSERNGNYGSDVWEFHSLRCVESWARLRKHAIEKEPLIRSGSNDVETTAKEPIKVPVSTPEKRLEELLAAFSIEPGTPLSVTDLVSITDIEKTWVRNTVTAMFQSGQLTQVSERRGPYPAKYVLRKTVNS